MVYLAIALLALLVLLLVMATFRFNFYQILPERDFPKQLLQKPIAHRGLFDKNDPENTLGAFQKAIDKGLVIEFDVMTTADNVPMVVHDSDLNRLTERSKLVKKTLFKDLAKLKVRDKASIPTLAEVLDLINGQTMIIVEIKNYGLPGKQERAIMEQLSQYSGPFVIQSFSATTLLWLRVFYPKLIRGQLLGASLSKNKLLLNLQMNFFNIISKPNYVGCSRKIIRKAGLNSARNKGLKVFGWTFDFKEANNHLATTYFDNIIAEDRSKR